MKVKIHFYIAGLILGLVGLSLLVSNWSSMRVITQENLRRHAEIQQLWQMQLVHLAQKQRLWLQIEYDHLSELIVLSGDDQISQTMLADFYKKNPDIRDVRLLTFDRQGRPRVDPQHPGCLNPDSDTQWEFEQSQVALISACRIGDNRIQEIAGIVSPGGEKKLLTASVNAFKFIDEFALATQKNIRLMSSSNQLFEFVELSEPVNSGDTLTLAFDVDEKAAVKIHLFEPRSDLAGLLWQQQLLVLLVLLVGGCLVYIQLHRGLIRPLVALSENMHEMVVRQQGAKSQKLKPIAPGLKVLHEYYHALLDFARHDSLTGLNNRFIFEERLAQAVNDGRRTGRKYGMILIEVTNLDQISHMQGQYIADGLVKQLARRLVSLLRESDNAARFEKNIFAVLLEIEDQDQLSSTAESIRADLNRQYVIYGREQRASTRQGVVIYPEHGKTPELLYLNASSALIEAGLNNRSVMFFQGGTGGIDVTGFTAIQSLRKAVDDNEFKLVYQPVIDLDGRNTVYFEALLRWKDVSLHEISIEKTIELAERNNLIKPLTNWIIETVCQLLASTDIAGLVIGVNLSMIDLHDKNLPERIRHYLELYRVKPSQIMIEITEGQIMKEPADVIEILAHLGVMGLSLSIDDFGTGQASLTYLKKLPVERLKIDQSFILDMVTSADDQSIVKATIDLAHTLDLKVVAEGVESVEILDMLRDMKCDYGQGYYISYPMDAKQIRKWYKLVTRAKGKTVAQD